MLSATEYVIRQARWPDDEEVLREIRQRVFIDEQGVPAALEWDGMDADCIHVLAIRADQRPIGTGRLDPKGKIGRLAVLKPWRSRGIGSALLRTLIQLGKALDPHDLYLHAQVRALTFYQSHGFLSVGGRFVEAGIPHQKMRYVFVRDDRPPMNCPPC